MTLNEVSSYLRYTPKVIKRLAEEGVIPGKKLGKEWRFPRDQIISLSHGKEEK